MTTVAEDLRVALGEVAPDLAVRICEPIRAWGAFAIAGPLLTRDEYAALERAKHIVADHRGDPMRFCVDCRWAVYVAQNPDAVESPCPHLEPATPL